MREWKTKTGVALTVIDGGRANEKTVSHEETHQSETAWPEGDGWVRHYKCVKLFGKIVYEKEWFERDPSYSEAYEN